MLQLAKRANVKFACMQVVFLNPPMGVLGALKAPLKFLVKVWNQVLPSHDSRTVLALPVAGLDEAIAHQIVSTLRSAATDEEEAELASLWLTALETSQIAANRCGTTS